MSAKTLPTRQLGRDGPQVTALGMGMMDLTFAYPPYNTEEENFRFLDRALELGQTFWDTSNSYAGNEDLLAKWFKRTGKRDQVFLASKFGNLAKDGKPAPDSSPEEAWRAIDKTLANLGVNHLDLWYCHRINSDMPIEKTVQAMAEIKAAGKVKYLGLSECSADTLRRAHAVHPITAIQMEYSPFVTNIEDDTTKVLATARELGVAVVAYSPLARGFLTGTLKSRDDLEENDFRQTVPIYSEENFPKNLELVEHIRAIAEKKGCTMTQLTLAWLLAQGDDIFPLPGTKRLSRLEENLGALNLTLTPDETAEIRTFADKIKKSSIGDRYGAAHLAVTMVTTRPLREGE